MTQNRKRRLKQLGLVVLIAIVIMALWPRITQSEIYHKFANDLGNVISNVAFLIAGILGLKTLWLQYQNPTGFASRSEMLPYLGFYIGVVLTAVGSTYYHLDPNNHRLVWDRLPMTLSFISMLIIVLSEHVSVRWSQILYLPLLALGFFSVAVWAIGDFLLGEGDLRLYYLVQFLPLILIYLMGKWFPSRYTYERYIYTVFGLYAAAKIFEVLDLEIFNLSLEIISGHELKHLFAAAATYVLIPVLRMRQPKPLVEG